MYSQKIAPGMHGNALRELITLFMKRMNEMTNRIVFALHLCAMLILCFALYLLFSGAMMFQKAVCECLILASRTPIIHVLRVDPATLVIPRVEVKEICVVGKPGKFEGVEAP
jgi:hypothetical protein